MDPIGLAQPGIKLQIESVSHNPPQIARNLHLARVSVCPAGMYKYLCL